MNVLGGHRQGKQGKRKTHVLIAVLTIPLFPYATNIYFLTNSISTSNVNYAASVQETLNIPDNNRCRGVEISTFRCPMGENTLSDYHESMDITYAHVEHEDMFHNCSNLPIPLTESSPAECWPRLIILPSHTTSGSKLFRGIWDLFGTQMSQLHERQDKEHNLFKDKVFSIGSIDIYWTLNTSTAIPFMQQPLIFKSHISETDASRRLEMKESLRKAKSIGVLRGVIRMARNPGDQLLRNTIRKQDKFTYNDYLNDAKRNCDLVVGTGDKNTFNIFHEFWNKIDLGIPEMIIHFEKMTSKNMVSDTIQSVISFLGNHDFGYYSNYLNLVAREQSDVIKSMIIDPDYEHGTFMAHACGVDAARKLHSETRKYSNALDYVFDNKTGHWSIAET